MKTLDYLLGPDAALFWPGVVVGVLIAIVGGCLSPLVVLRRMAFIGQGVSHAAFAGVGIGTLAVWLSGGALPVHSTIDVATGAVCISSGLGIAWLSRRGTGADTAIGIVLVGAMALGFILLRLSGPRVATLTGATPPTMEQVLFGSLLLADWGTVAAAALGSALVLGALWWWRRAILFWAFDPDAAEAFGAPVHALRVLVIVLLALTIVLAMRVAGVVLASAVLIAPGAGALALSARLGRVIGVSIALAVASVMLGLVLSFELALPPGPGIGLTLVGAYALARALGRAA